MSTAKDYRERLARVESADLQSDELDAIRELLTEFEKLQESASSTAGFLMKSESRVNGLQEYLKTAKEHIQLLRSALSLARKTMTNLWHDKPRIGMEEACAQADVALAETAPTLPWDVNTKEGS